MKTIAYFYMNTLTTCAPREGRSSCNWTRAVSNSQNIRYSLSKHRITSRTKDHTGYYFICPRSQPYLQFVSHLTLSWSHTKIFSWSRKMSEVIMQCKKEKQVIRSLNPVHAFLGIEI